MKKIIIILGTIILGVYIVATLIMGKTGSLKDTAKEITDRSNTIITDQLLIIDSNTNK